MLYDPEFGDDEHLWRLIRTEIVGAVSDLDQFRSACRAWINDTEAPEALELYNKCVEALLDDGDDSDERFISTIGATCILEMLSDRLCGSVTGAGDE